MPRVGALLPLLLCASVLVPSPGGAQTADQPVVGHVTKRWTTADGLPHNWISAIVQTRDGFLWIGTNNAGLVRFDGVTFKTFNVLNTPALSSDTINRLCEDADGTLWIGTASGLVRYRDGEFAPEPLQADLAGRPVVDLRADRDGRMWLAVEDAVARRDEAAWTVVLPATNVHRLWSSADGAMWIAASQGLIEWRDRVVRSTPLNAPPGGRVLALLDDRRGRLWIGTSFGLMYLDRREGALQRVTLRSTHIASLFEDGAGTLWIGASNRLFSRTPEGGLSESVLESDTQQGSTAVITEDREGNLWFGVEGWRGGLYRLMPRRATMLTLGPAACDNIGSVTQGGDGTIWLATYCSNGQGVFSIRNQDVKHHPGPAFVSALLAEPDDTVWVGAYGPRLYRSSKPSSPDAERRFDEIRTPMPERANFISTFYRDREGALWFGTRAGVFRWHGEEWTSVTSRDGLPNDEVRSIAGGDDGAIWIGTTDGISRYQNGRVTTYRATDGAPGGPVRALHVDADGTVWIGTYGGGLARLRNGMIVRYGPRDGMLDSSVHRIIEDDEGYLWLAGDRGIRRVAKRDLNLVADGADVTPDVMVFNEADGMRSVECNGMAQPAGWRMQDGTLHFPTQAGVVRIDPAALAPPAPAPLPQIEEATVDNAPFAAQSELLVPAGYRDVTLRYTAPAFGKPELVQFRYRLEGYSDEWVDVGSRRIASFANLRPGRYRFLLSARSGPAWSEQPAALVLVLQPYFHQRLPVQIAFALVVAATGLGAGLGYVRRTRRRASELEQAVAQRTSELAKAHQIVSGAHADLAQAKQLVDQAHGQLLSVFDQLDIGVLVLNDRGLVRFASTAAQRVLQKGESALLNQPWSAALPLIETDRALVKARVERRSAGSGRLPTQLVIAGTRYWIEIDVRDEPPPGDGRILYMYNVAEMSGGPAGAGATGMFGLVGRSTAMHLLYKQIRDVARMDSTVLIQGETGVGKELVARAIHRESLRSDKPFIAVNAAGLSESLVASQLFGHRRGAFTGAVDDQVGVFEAAGGGTVFLDELGDMPPGVQVSLLRVLQEREITRLGDTQPRRVDVRFLAATHRDLAREVEARRFREDLLYRIRVTTLAIPALRQRMDDVPLLVETFVAETAGHSNRVVPAVSREAMDALMRYDWPGNVRQLRAAIERALVNATGDLVRRDDLPPEILGGTIPDDLEEGSERERLLRALREAKGNRAEAARLLGINRTTLYRRLRRWGMDSEPEK